MPALPDWKFKSPNLVSFGYGVVNEIGDHLKKLKAASCLVVTDPGLVAVGLVGKVMEPLASAGIAATLFSEVQPEPVVENVEAALSLYKANACQAIVGFGGGSAIDVAKAAAMLVTNPGSFQDYAGIGKVVNKSAPFIAVPTTAGTGSEVSMFSIMVVGGNKMGVVDHLTMPDVALVDPLLSLSVPRKAKAATGLDAFCHHLESYLSTNASPFCDAICLEGIKAISENLRAAVAGQGNLDAHYGMTYASMLGGYVMNLTEGAAANHGLAFALGAKFHVPHGLSNAVLLPHVLRVVAEAEHRKIARVGEVMGLNLTGLSPVECVDATIEAVARLVADVGCLLPLSSLGVTEKDLDELTRSTMTQTRVMGHSTYTLTPEEIRSVFAAAL